jgi:hypothetical protein
MDWQGRLGLAELDAACDLAVMHVEARYDLFGDHRAHSNADGGANQMNLPTSAGNFYCHTT